MTIKKPKSICVCGMTMSKAMKAVGGYTVGHVCDQCGGWKCAGVKPVTGASVIFSAIKKHARRVKDGRSHFNVDQQMNAIIALANFGSKQQTKERK